MIQRSQLAKGKGGFLAYIDDGGFDNDDDHGIKVSDDDHFQNHDSFC